jgi:hypothetical protein
VNPTSQFNQNRNNEKLAKGHWQNIMYALSILGDATNGEITKFINEKANRDVEDEFDPSHAKNIGKTRELLMKESRRELDDRSIDRKTTLKWLKRMIEKGWVKTKHDVYWLTPEGRNKKIFGQYYGMALWDKLMTMPLKGSFEERLEEYVKRVGIYITYVFMRNSARSGLESRYSPIRSDDDEWVNDSISTPILLEWFNNVFYPKSKSKSSNYDKLVKSLSARFSEYINTLEDSERTYYEKVFPFLHKNSMSMLKMREEGRLDYT